MALRKSAPPREDPQQYVLKKQYKKAIEIYRGIIASTPDDPNQHLRLGDCLVLDGQARPAIAEYKQAALLFANQGFLLKAIGVNKKIVKLDPSQEEVHKSLSDLYQERGLLSGGDSSQSGVTIAPVLAATAAPAKPGRMQFDLEDTSEHAEIDLGMESLDDGMDLELGAQGDANEVVGADLVGDLAPELDSDLLDGLDMQPEELPAPIQTRSRTSTGFEELPNDISLDALGDALAEMPEDTLSALAELGHDMGASDLGASDLGASDLGASDLGASDLGASDLGTGAELESSGFDQFGLGQSPAEPSELGQFEQGSPGSSSAFGQFEFGPSEPGESAFGSFELGDSEPEKPEAGQFELGRFELGQADPVANERVDGGTPGLGLELEPDAAALSSSDAFRRTPLFSDFTPEEFVEVVKKMEQETYAADTVVVKEGDPGDAMFVIVSGSVRVVTNASGKELYLAQLREGDFFGEGSLITGKPRTATILTNEESDLLILHRAGLEEIEAIHPRVREVLTKFFKQRAENTVRTILSAKK